MDAEMRYVYEVYRHKSFSKAANALFMTQPALSISIQKLEQRLGMPLFDRTSKPLRLTEAGELYIRKYQEILALENELSEQINDLSSLTKGNLRIGGSHYFNSYILPPVLTDFSDRYPGIKVELIEAGSNYLLDMLYEHQIDITFNSSEHPTDSFRRIPCFSDTVLLAVPGSYPIPEHVREYAMTCADVVNKKHLQDDFPSIDLNDFVDIPFLLLKAGNNLHKRSQIFFKEAGINPDIRLQVSQLATVWHLCSSGMGATFVSDFLVSNDPGNVFCYKINSPETRRVFDLTLSDRHYVSNAMKAFIEVFKEWYSI